MLEHTTSPNGNLRKLHGMNWTSTQYIGWVDQCHKFAAQRMPFRLDHVCGPKEQEFCENFCAGQNYRQEECGSTILFTPAPMSSHRPEA